MNNGPSFFLLGLAAVILVAFTINSEPKHVRTIERCIKLDLIVVIDQTAPRGWYCKEPTR